MTAPVKERGTRRSLPLHFCSTFRISLRSRSVCPFPLRSRSARLPKFPVGKKTLTSEGRRFSRAAPKLSDPGEGPARKPRATLLRRARAPKPTAPTPHRGALICCDSRAFLAPSCGYGSYGRGSRGYYGRRTLTSRPCGRRCGRHPSRGPAARAGRTHGRTARAGAASAAGRASTCRSGTSSARTALPHCAGRRAADGRRSIHRSPARSSRDAGRVGAALRPSGYHLRANKKPAPTQTAYSGSCGAGAKAQALVDIHDGLHPATLAVDRQVFCSGSWIEPKDFATPASRAHQPSVLCDQFTIIPF